MGHQKLLQEGGLWTHLGQDPTIWHMVPLGHWMSLHEGRGPTHLGHPSNILHMVPFWQWTSWHDGGLWSTEGWEIFIGPHQGHPSTMWHTVPCWHWMSLQEGGFWTQRGWFSITLQEVPLGHWTSRHSWLGDALVGTHRGQPLTTWHLAPCWHWTFRQVGWAWTQ